MAFKEFVKANLVLVVGLTLPIVLMAGFLVASSLPERIADPPKYNLVFSVTDFSQGAAAIPVSVRLVVQDGVLKAQYTKLPAQQNGYVNNIWKKLYLYDAAARKVQELSFAFPPNMDAIEGTVVETVDATKDLRLNTTLQSPDGYELARDSESRSGLINEIFWGGGYSNEYRLRKDGSSIRLPLPSANVGYGSVEFIGWVTGGSR